MSGVLIFSFPSVPGSPLVKSAPYECCLSAPSLSPCSRGSVLWPLLSSDPELAHPRLSPLGTLDPLLPCGPCLSFSPAACLAVQGSLGMLAHSWPVPIRWLILWAPSPPALSSQLPSLFPKCPFKQLLFLSPPPRRPSTTQLSPPCPGQKDYPSWTLYPLLAPLWLAHVVWFPTWLNASLLPADIFQVWSLGSA